VSDPTPRAPPRCTLAERRLRVLELQTAIATGESPGAAARRLCKAWNLTARRSPRRYVALAIADWSRDRKLSGAASLDVALAVRRKLLRDAASAGDFTAALRAAEGIDDLLGVGARSGLTVGEISRSLAPTISAIITAVRSELHDAETLSRVVAKIMGALDETEPATNGSTFPRNRAFPSNGTH
jgi:hypothetical protein